MKTMKRFCALLSALMLLCATALSAAASETYITLYGFAFNVNAENSAVIHGYDDRSADMIVPAALMGYPVSEIADYACFNDTAITSVSFAKATALTRIGVNAFFGCAGLTELTLPATLTELGFGAFQNCAGLQKLVIENGLQAIPGQAFYNCTALSDITLPESVTVIGERAFGNCPALKKLPIPDTVTEIAENAFDGSENLVIYASQNSYACAYAAEQEIPCVRTDVGYLIGDADGDGEVTVLDATRVQRILAEFSDDTDGMSAVRGDVDGDGLNILDATKIQRHLADLSTGGNVGKFFMTDELLLNIG